MALDTTFWNGETLRIFATKSRTDGGTLREWRVGAAQAGRTETNLGTPTVDAWQGVIFQNANIARRWVRTAKLVLLLDGSAARDKDLGADG